MTQKPTLIERLDFTMTRGSSGLYYVRCAQVPGLLATGRSIPFAIEETARAYVDLVTAGAGIPQKLARIAKGET